MEIGNEQKDVASNRAAVITAGQQHAFSGSHKNSFLVIDVRESMLGSFQTRYYPWQQLSQSPFVQFGHDIDGLCHFIAQQISRFEPGSIRSEVISSVIIESLANSSEYQTHSLPLALQKSIRFINKHCCDPISLADVAQNAGISTSWLHTLFAHWLQTSPHHYLSRCRLQRSRYLLENTEMTLCDVALHVGYTDQAAFTRAFRKALKQTPGAYRRTRTTRAC